MPNGEQLKAENIVKFQTWRDNHSDDHFRQMVHRGQLNRKEIAKECDFGRSVFEQNPEVARMLGELEKRLRQNGVLPSLAAKPADDEDKSPLMREAGKQTAALTAERMRRLETQNATLQAENAELKRLLSQYTVLHQALSLTGRIPR